MRASTFIKDEGQELFMHEGLQRGRESMMSTTTFGDFSGNTKLKRWKSYIYIILAFVAIIYTIIVFWTSVSAYTFT